MCFARPAETLQPLSLYRELRNEFFSNPDPTPINRLLFNC
jgi:hypothetical protein